MSMRPVPASTICVKVAWAPPARMKLPSWTARTRTADGLNVSVSDNPDRREALVAETATVYGPAPTRNSGPGGVTTICAPAGAIAGEGLVGVVAEGAGGGAPGTADCGPGPGGAGAGAAGTAVVPGVGELPGGMIDTPGAAAAGGTAFGAAG